MIERSFRTMGTEVRVLIGARLDAGLPEPESMAAQVEAALIDFDRQLSRFRPESELSRLNRDPREVVPASALLRSAVRAAIWAAERTGGLVDPTLLPELEAIGYAESRVGLASSPLSEALAGGPPRRPARPSPATAWRGFAVCEGEDEGAIRRPPGLMLDSGGIGKGMAADMIAPRLSPYSRYVIDCGGDVRVGGRLPWDEPVEIELRHPLSGAAIETFPVTRGAVATSGIDARLWRTAAGHAHHLIDPSSGDSAWTGLISASARAPTALEADTLAKAALLSGPAGAHEFLQPNGGLIVADDGGVVRIGAAGAGRPTPA